MQQKIHKNTFRGCTRLKKISLPNTILSIDDGAFYGCTSLQKADIGDGVKFIGLSAFCNDTSLSSVDRLDSEDGTKTFDIVCDYAFSNTGLTKANLALRSSSIYTFWGDSVFENCQKLTNVRILSANYLSKNMFKDCPQLSSITFDKNYMAYTYPGVFEGCRSLTSISLPAQLIFVTQDMFKYCTSLKSVHFDEYDAFGNYVGSNINLIQKDAFLGCSNLQSIYFPKSIQSIDQIEDGAFNGLNLLDNNVQITFSGLNITDIGSKVIDTYEEYIYGKSIEVTSTIQLMSLLHYSLLLHVPIIFIRQYKFSFYYGTNRATDHKIVYLSDVPKVNRKYVPYMVDDIKNYFNSNLQTKPYKFDGKYTSNNINYDISKQRIILCEAMIDLGFAMPYLGYDDVQYYAIVNDDNFTATSLSAIFGLKPTIDEDGNTIEPSDDDLPYPENITESQLTHIEKKYSALAAQIRAYKYSYGEQQPSLQHLFREHRKQIVAEASLYKKQDIMPRHIDAYMYAKHRTSVPIYSAPFNFAFYTGKQYIPVTGKHLNFDGIRHISQYDSAEQLDAEFKKYLGKYYKNNLIGYTSTVQEGTLIPVDSVVNHVFHRTLTQNGFFRAYPKVNTANYKKYKQLDIIGYYKENSADDEEIYTVKMALTTDNASYKAYTAPTKFSSDKSTIRNFQVGTWYYNAQELFNQAIVDRKPALFIYSLLGCGPCAIYQNNIWNNGEFQEWSAKQKFYMCGMEVEKQPLFDKQLQFCVSTLSPSAKNFAKLDQRETIDSKTPNLFGEVFTRQLINGTQYSSNLMTPVLVFMRPIGDDGWECWDYTFHNIAAIIKAYGKKSVIDFIKRMCLYYFDENTVKEDGYVKDCDTPFDLADFPKPPRSNNPYEVSERLIDFGISSPWSFNAKLASIQVNHGYVYSNSNIEQAYKTAYGDYYEAFPYLGNCWFLDIDYLDGLFDTNIERAFTAQDLMDNYVNKENWKFRFGDSIYTLSFDDQYCITGTNTPCCEGVNVFIPIWTKIS